jgi:hypothetical protein
MPIINIKTLFTKASLVTLIKIFLPGILVLGIGAVCHLIYKMPFSVYSRDPIQVLEGKPYVGIISSIGILLWSATASIIYFSALLIAKQHKSKQLVGFLLYAGIFTTLLLFDDLFLFHDVIFPDYLKINENFFYIPYGIILLIFIIQYRKLLLETDYILLLLAFGFFIGSAGTDQFIEYVCNIPGEYILEDGFKLLGIISWFAFFSRTCYRYVKIKDFD